MRRLVLALLLTGLVAVPGRTQTALPPGGTPEQIKLAEIEVGRLVPLLKLEPGMRIADVGAGLGAWAFRFARWTGNSGHVYATDISDEALPLLRPRRDDPQLCFCIEAWRASRDRGFPAAAQHNTVARRAGEPRRPGYPV